MFQAEDGIRYLVRSRGLGDVYKRQGEGCSKAIIHFERYDDLSFPRTLSYILSGTASATDYTCLLYTSDAADERSSVDLGGRRIINKKTKKKNNSEAI